MDTLVQALGPVFAAGFAVQQLLELIGPILDGAGDNKKLVAGMISVAAGLGLAFGAGLSVLEPLGVTGAHTVDRLTTALIISGGTEGVNSVLKFLKYTKEDKKNEAAAKSGPPADKAAAVAQLKMMNLK